MASIYVRAKFSVTGVTPLCDKQLSVILGNLVASRAHWPADILFRVNFRAHPPTADTILLPFAFLLLPYRSARTADGGRRMRPSDPNCIHAIGAIGAIGATSPCVEIGGIYGSILEPGFLERPHFRILERSSSRRSRLRLSRRSWACRFSAPNRTSSCF